MDDGVSLRPPPVCTGRGRRWFTHGVRTAYAPCSPCLSPRALPGRLLKGHLPLPDVQTRQVGRSSLQAVQKMRWTLVLPGHDSLHIPARRAYCVPPTRVDDPKVQGTNMLAGQLNGTFPQIPPTARSCLDLGPLHEGVAASIRPTVAAAAVSGTSFPRCFFSVSKDVHSMVSVLSYVFVHASSVA